MRNPLNRGINQDAWKEILALKKRLQDIIAGTGGGPSPHASSHENGGGDELNVGGLSGVLADPQTVDTDASGALDGDGSSGSPLAVRVDGSTIQINGSNELEAVGSSGDSRLIVIVKAANEIVNDSVTLQNDDDFAFSVAANKTYLVDLYLRLNGGIAADFKFAWTLPAGASVNWAAEAEGGGGGLGFYWAPKDTAQGSQQALNTGTISVNGSANTPQGMHLTAIIIVGGTAGTAQLQWAQNTQTVADSIVLANSMLRAVTS